MSLVLASASPRRAELLGAAGFTFDIVPADVDESRHPGEEPTAYALRVARDKARVVAAGRPDDWVVAADTIVVVDDLVLGKPRDEADAARMLEQLSGRDHVVITGTVVRHRDDEKVWAEPTRVRFAPLGADEIGWYVASGEPRDKAGAYAIQGLASRFITGIEGSYGNVVGLPVEAVCRLLRELRFPACGPRPAGALTP